MAKVPPKPGQADTSNAKKNKKKDQPSGSATKKKSKSSKRKKSSPSCGASNEKDVADLLVGVLSLIVPGVKGVVMKSRGSNK
ncbi:hypothetical protein RCL_jg13120.t1 [Rhizophagus clarus]|uniref:Uncharacterized protein n=1 Tax=Rhizophagus clarus TaxID=94130 RepID=A0A8H3KVL1_9GLOM|nr:hypothetical protein RCL_jg13120.t1 [Rhizophagus clarus]